MLGVATQFIQCMEFQLRHTATESHFQEKKRELYSGSPARARRGTLGEEARRLAVTFETNHVAVQVSWIKGEARFIIVFSYMYYSLGVSKLNNVAGELASFSFPLVRLWSGGATRVGGPTYFQRHAMVPARCVRDDTGGRLCSPAVQLELRPARGVAWSVAWRAQVKPGGGEECDSANKYAPRRRKRPGFSLFLPPSRRGRRLSERHSPHCVVAPQGDQ